jgi:ABC-type transporter MlaC component
MRASRRWPRQIQKIVSSTQATQWLRITLLGLSLILPASAAVGAVTADTSAAAAVSRVVNTLETSSHGRAAGVIRSSFDINAIAQTIAGKYWSTATPRQRAEFAQALLSATIANIFVQLGDRRSLDIDVGRVRRIAKGDALVSTKVTKRDGRVYRVDWRLRPCAAGLCIVDILVDGGSMAIQLRDRAAPFLSANGGGISELSHRLRANPTHPFG